MITREENLLVKLVKKAVGLPTGNSNCCGPATIQTGNECCGTEASENGAADCTCGTVPPHEEQRPREA